MFLHMAGGALWRWLELYRKVRKLGGSAVTRHIQSYTIISMVPAHYTGTDRWIPGQGRWGIRAQKKSQTSLEWEQIIPYAAGYDVHIYMHTICICSRYMMV